MCLSLSVEGFLGWILFAGKINVFLFIFFMTIRLMLGSGCTSGTWEPIRVQQPPLSMDLTNQWSTTLLLTGVGKAWSFQNKQSINNAGKLWKYKINVLLLILFFRPMLKKVLEKIGLDVHLPCHVSIDQKASLNTGPEFMEILASAKWFESERLFFSICQ